MYKNHYTSHLPLSMHVFAPISTWFPIIALSN
jgi:hypothetical protein